jgi:hypothetical protein
MRAQLHDSRRPIAGPRRTSLAALPRPAPPRLAVTNNPGPGRTYADSDGLGLLFRLLLATLVVVAVVVGVDAVGEDWILVPAMAIHLSLTYAVLHGIFLLVKAGSEGEGPDE